MTTKFVFRSNQIIGASSAESDEYYLSRCFVDTGDLVIIRNCEDPRNILVGRTGSGKSALLSKLADVDEHVIQISPESLSLSYIANSNILKFFSEAGVRMDIFYRLLWRHIFCVEVLKERFQIDSEERKRSFLERLWYLIPRNKQDEMALSYLRQWGESFWEETEYRIKEVTTKLEHDLQGTIEGKVPNLISLSAGSAKKLTEEQKEDVVHRAQDVVNKVQIKELTNIIKLIDKILLDNRQQRYYVAIDRLDEDWVEDQLRFRLIRALIETSVDFTRIPNLKVIVALCSDLLDCVYRYTRDTGFQEEKYQTSTLDISWTKKQLIEVLDKRIDVLIRDQYTSTIATHKDVLPGKVGKQATIDYLIERTLMRPRDIIQFFNICIKKADGKTVITLSALREAEGAYSRDRLKALFDEWFGLYPNLAHLFQILKGHGYIFSIQDLSLEDLEENLLQLLTSGKGKYGADLDAMQMVFDGNMSVEEYRKEVALIFYRTGLIALKINAQAPFSWSHMSGVSVSAAEITDTTKLQIHKTFWRVLGVYNGSEIEPEG